MKKENKKRADTLPKESVRNGHAPPLISYGKRELDLLRYMSNSRDERLNVKGYARLSSIPRASIYYMLEKLMRDDLIEKPYSACYKITNKGINVVDVTNGGVSNVGSMRRKDLVSDKTNLSCHYIKYKAKIVDREHFSLEKVKKLNPKRTRKLALKNLTQYYLYFDDATITVNPKMIILSLHDIVSENAESADFESFNKAVGYLSKLEKVGLKTENIELDTAHYARVKSILAESLKKIDDRYYLELDNGHKFFIDYSDGTIEDETTSSEMREKVDGFFKDLNNTDSKLSDLDKIKDILGTIAKLETTRLISSIDPEKLGDIKGQNKLPSYFG